MPDQSFIQKFRSSLKLKLSLIVIILSVSSTLLASLINFNQVYLPLLPIPIFCSTIGVFLIYLILKPIDLLKEGHPSNIKTGDELDLISSHLAKPLIKEDSLETDRLKSVVSSLTDGIIVLNLNRQVVLANSAAEKLTGYTQTQMLNQPIDRLILLINKDGNQINPGEYCPLQLHGSTATLFNTPDNIKLIGNNNNSHTVKLSCSQIDSSLSTDLGFILDLEDRSKEKTLEAVQLDFVSMASHELRTPLTSIRGYLSVFLGDNKDKLTPEQKEQLERIQVSGDQLAGIIDNLLSVSKVERGAFSLSAQAIDYQKLLQKTVEDNKIQASSKNISLTLEILGTLPEVHADPIRISEVLNNLISNAISYTQEGGAIKVGAKFGGKEIITSVTDNGRGIPADAIPHLFTKFFRVQEALDQSSNSKGTGLGLYISKSIIDLHHGKIWVESPGLGKGTTFYFTLPVKS